MEECDCEDVCMWACEKALTCRSRIMREYAEILDEDDLDDEDI